MFASTLASEAALPICSQSFVDGSRVSLSTEISSSRPGFGEVASEERLKEGSEDNLSTTELGQSQPEGENKLEGIVEGEPVDCVNCTLQDSQK